MPLLQFAYHLNLRFAAVRGFSSLRLLAEGTLYVIDSRPEGADMPSTSISENWLRELITFDYTPEELASRLVAFGIEIDDIVNSKESLAPFRVAKVESVVPHPDADRLSVCTVNDGSGEELTVVCGAPNVAAGQKVAFAPVGTEMPGAAFTIGKRKLRGVMSEGMICSEKELGLGDGEDGILVLEPEAPIGASLSQIYGDVIYNVDLTPNRGDCAGHLGIAREVRAMNGNEIKNPGAKPQESEGSASEVVTIEIEDPGACSHYVARVVTGVTVTESPDWLKRRLTAIGVRPINNVVDAASYVMFETGHPLHAFDYSKVADRRIGVRRSSDSEKFTTLDGKERELPEGTILITDALKPVAIAGIMGGENSEIDARSTDLLIESAWFDPASIRASARALGLSTDASYRFERGADPGVLKRAVDRAAALVQSLAGGEVLNGYAEAGGEPTSPLSISLRYDTSRTILGVVIPPEEQIGILDSLGFQVLETIEEGVSVAVPSWRSDVTAEIDLIEEIGRVYGFDRIPEVVSTGALSFPQPEPIVALNDRLRSYLVSQGFTEAVLQFQTDPESATRYASGGAVELMNGLGRDTSFLRSSLLPSLGGVVSLNQRHDRSNLRMFEIGKAFRRGTNAEQPVEGIVEMEEVALVLAGNAEPEAWSHKSRTVDIYDMKGIVTQFILRIGRSEPEFRVETEELWGFDAPAISVHIDGSEVGRIGGFDRWIREKHDISGHPVVFVADLGRISGTPRESSKFAPPARFPRVTRDLSILVNRSVRHQDIVETISSDASDLLQSVALFDIYEGKKGEIDSAMKSMSYRLIFGSDEKTLEESDIDGEFGPILKRLTDNLGATLRS